MTLSQYVITTLVLTHITIISVTVYLHRSMSHRSVDVHPILAHFFRFWLWLTTSMITQEWVAVHRKHHATNDTDQDPHSPRRFGLKRVLWLGVLLYTDESKNRETVKKFGHGCPDDWVENNVYKRYQTLGVILMLVIDAMTMGWPGVAVWAVQMLWIPFLAAGVVNGIGHSWGYRNFEVDDRSTNFFPWGILIGGEELHNNHHAYPTSAKLSYQWYEFDLCYLYIKVLSWFGLTKIRKVMPSRHLEKARIESVKQFLHHRLIILKKFSRSVMLPILKEKKSYLMSKIQSMSFSKIVRLMMAPNRKLTQREMDCVSLVNSLQDSIKCCYQAYDELYKILFENQREQKVVAVAKWCQQAKNSGIERLSKFADSLHEQIYELGAAQ